MAKTEQQISEEKIEAVKKALGEPLGLQASDDLLKTRRNLMVAGALSVFIWSAGLSLHTPSDGQSYTVFGIALKGLSHQDFMAALSLLLLYLIAHFVWGSVDLMAEFRLRVTGSRVAHVTAGKYSVEEKDHPDDPRQSTLYNWWIDQARSLENFPQQFRESQESLSRYLQSVEAISKLSDDQFDQNLNNVLRSGAEVNVQLQKLSVKLDQTIKIVESNRVPISLQRFDNAFRAHAVIQNLRWIPMDFLIPVGLGIFGFGTALNSI